VNDRLAEQRIRIEQNIDAGLPLLWVDQELLRNCILNFINNAAQAMNDGGVIRLGATVDESGGRVRLTFADQGSGILQEDISKIFQPYFTTKDVGIGLGLAITERIIKEHGGEILVESNPNEGTTFTVLLPLQQEHQGAT
jgi:signal transduction histidine kinase